MVARGEIARFWSLESLHMGMCAQNELLYRANVADPGLFLSQLRCFLSAAACRCECVCESSFVLVQRLRALLIVDVVNQRKWLCLWYGS